MKPSEIASALKWAMLANRPVHIVGEPGVGKTSVVNQVSKELGRTLIYSRLGEMESVDLRGLPITDLKTGTTKWLRPDEFPMTTAPITWFFDEWCHGLPSVQSVAGRLVLERRLGSYIMPDSVYLCAASNRAKDRASVNRMPAQVADRFTWLTMEPHAADWRRWALDNGIETEVIAFLGWRPDYLSAFDPTKDVSATCRSWEFISDLLKVAKAKGLQMSANVEERTYAGTIGDGIACEFVGFLKVFRNMPDPTAMLMDPDKCPIPTDPATLAAMTAGLARKANDTNFDRVVKIAKRMQAEFGALMVIMATGRDKVLCSTRAYIDYVSDHQELIV